MSLDLQAVGIRSADVARGAQVQSAGSMSLGQEDFLTLLVTQLKNQDPLSPLDNEAFVAQLAQFSTVSGITEMNQSLKTLATGSGDMRSSAPQWIGRTITTADSGGTVSSISFTAEGGLLLNLDDGREITLSDIRSVS